MQMLWWRGADAQIVDDEKKVWAPVSFINPLADKAQSLRTALDGSTGRLVIWGGWSGQGDPAQGRFEPDPEVWLPSGRERFDRFRDEAGPIAAAASARLLWRPHAATALSDLPGCVALSRTTEETGFGLLADPVGLLTPDTLGDAEDHLRRAGEVFAAIDGVEGVLLADASIEGGSLTSRPIGEGDLGIELLRRTLAPLLDGARPLVLLDESRESQRALLD